jgi:uncharacterized membrane protein
VTSAHPGSTDAAPSAPARPLLRAAAATFAVMAAVQISIPLLTDRAVPVTVVVVTFCATSGLLLTDRWGPARALGAFGSVAALTLAVEAIGHGTGFPFGTYEYSGDLQPQAAGVPVIVPLAWFAMAVPALAVGEAIVRRPWAVVLVAAWALTAWDLFLDPQMVEEGYWTWPGGGPYRDIPLSNYAGWFATAVLVMLLLHLLADRRAQDRHGDPQERRGMGPAGGAPGAPVELVALYSWWAVMQTVGFVAFFGDPLVGLVGGVGMGVPAALAWRALRR